MMNRLAIELNNIAVDELKAGNVMRAFELLSNASSCTAQGNHVHVDSEGQTYRYQWEDCTSALACKLPEPLHIATEGCTPFLYMRFLKVTTPYDRDNLIDRLCPCGFAWVLWYK